MAVQMTRKRLYYLSPKVTGEVNPGDIPGLQPWSAATTYAQDDFVEYGRKIWKSRQGNNQGNVPAENAYWTEISAEELAHIQNTDTHLAKGTPDEVSAAELRRLLNNQIVLERFVSSDNIVKTAHWLFRGAKTFGPPQYSVAEIISLDWEVRLSGESSWMAKADWAAVQAYSAARNSTDQWYLRGTAQTKAGLENIEIGIGIQLV
ncbi:hypothetical protein AAG747_14010 [Rapidithrix thailandica]|uniref:Uncharacterized protein n=1 Tax=Rapidithrix thailandica TaxID=413964 RepID=A0AAW9S9J9_9BACT